MSLRFSTSIAVAALALAATTASAQVTLVSQNRSVTASSNYFDPMGGPPCFQTVTFTAPDLGTFNQTAMAQCPGARIGTAEQNSTVSANRFETMLSAERSGNAPFSSSSALSSYEVVFDVTQSTAFTSTGFSTGAELRIVGPGVDRSLGNSEQGVLAPGRYTLSCMITADFNNFGGSLQNTLVFSLGNNDCANASPITLGATPFSTVDATTDGPTPQPECDPNFPDFLLDVWYRFVPGFSGDLVVSTCNAATFDTKIAAYAGGCEALTLLACSEDDCLLQSVFTVPVASGEPILIRVGGYSNFAFGTGTLSLNMGAPPPFTIDWFSIDGGGGSTSGGSFALSGTIGQHDATSALSGATFTLTGGFWLDLTPPCLADFNHDGTVDFFDYLDFVAAFSSSDPAADFNQDSVIDFFDYLDFVAAFSAGC